MLGNSPGSSAILGRPFDHHAWSLVAATPSAGLAPASGADGDLARSRDLCRAMAEAALARLLGKPGDSRPGRVDSLADRLADLRRGLGGRPRPRRRIRAIANRRRPRTVRFFDDAEAVGLRFVFDNGQTPQHLLPETMSGGVALLDYDGDGWLDVYCVQGGSLAAAACRRPRPIRRPATASSATAATGPSRMRPEPAKIAAIAGGLEYGMGVAVGDYDNDGHPDLFLTRLHRYALLRNRGDGTFEDVTGPAGLAGVRDNPTSAAFADLDGDGDLDLYVCHYIRSGSRPPRALQERARGILLLRSGQVRAGRRPRVPQRRRAVRGRDRRRGFHRPGWTGPGRRGGGPRR